VNPPIPKKSQKAPIVLDTLAIDKTQHRKSTPPTEAAGATRADSLGESIISADMEPDKLADDVRDRMEIEEDNMEPTELATVEMDTDADGHDISQKRESSAITGSTRPKPKSVNERGITGSPPDKKSREQRLSLVSPAETTLMTRTIPTLLAHTYT
jgi:hypothetical protein